MNICSAGGKSIDSIVASVDRLRPRLLQCYWGDDAVKKSQTMPWQGSCSDAALSTALPSIRGREGLERGCCSGGVREVLEKSSAEASHQGQWPTQ